MSEPVTMLAQIDDLFQSVSDWMAGEGEEDVESEELNEFKFLMSYETYDQTFATKVEVTVFEGYDAEEVKTETFDEVSWLFNMATITFDVTDTLDSNGDLLFGKSLKATFTFDEEAETGKEPQIVIIDGIACPEEVFDALSNMVEADGEYNSNVYVKYVYPAMKAYIAMGDVNVVEQIGEATIGA